MTDQTKLTCDHCGQLFPADRMITNPSSTLCFDCTIDLSDQPEPTKPPKPAKMKRKPANISTKLVTLYYSGQIVGQCRNVPRSVAVSKKKLLTASDPRNWVEAKFEIK